MSLLSIDRQVFGAESKKTPLTAELSTNVLLANVLTNTPVLCRVVLRYSVEPLNNQMDSQENIAIDFSHVLFAIAAQDPIPSTLKFGPETQGDGVHLLIKGKHKQAQQQQQLQQQQLQQQQQQLLQQQLMLQQQQQQQQPLQQQQMMLLPPMPLIASDENQSESEQDSDSAASSSSMDSFAKYQVSAEASIGVSVSFSVGQPQPQPQPQAQPQLGSKLNETQSSVVESDDDDGPDQHQQTDCWTSFVGRRMTKADEPVGEYVSTQASETLANGGRVPQGKYHEYSVGTFCERCGNTSHTHAAMCQDRADAVLANPLLQMCPSGNPDCTCLFAHTPEEQAEAQRLTNESGWMLSKDTMCWLVVPAKHSSGQKRHVQGCCEPGHEWRDCEYNKLNKRVQ